MNERIKQMCEHSKAYATECTKDFTGDEPVEWMDYYTEKFAELIVIKCLDIVDKKVSGMVGVAAMKEIEEYFGIEE